jgi:hypothetical protein
MKASWIPRALFRNLENLFRGRNPQPELSWTWKDYAALAGLGVAVFLVAAFL